MDIVRRPVVHDVKLHAGGGREVMVGSLCVSAYYLLYSTRRHEGNDEITVYLSETRKVVTKFYADAQHSHRAGGV